MLKWNYILVGVIIILIVLFFVYKQYHYVDSDNPIILEVKRRFKLMGLNYVPIQEGNSSYTQNKRYITLCLKDPKTKLNYDINTMFYVSLHEMAHMTAKGIGHGEEFKNIFSKLLQKATLLGLYDPTLEIPRDYCGVEN